MATTGPRREAQSVIVREAAELATGGFAGVGVASAADVNLVFSTIAQECKTPDERRLYLLKCKAEGLNPLKGELFATRRAGRLVFVTAYGVFVSRAARRGFVISGEAVCEGDDWGGWDAKRHEPINHVIAKRGEERGNVIGAYAYATHVASQRRMCSGYWTWPELISDPDKLEAKDGFMWRRLTQHMSKRTAWLRVARLVAPDLASLYGPEEFGVVNPEETDAEAAPLAAAVPLAPPTEEERDDASNSEEEEAKPQGK